MLCTLLIIGCLVSKTIGSKRYDVEAEALKLYGEDIRDVIARFRRTPDYLRILNAKIESMRTRMGDIMIQTHFYYDQKLKEKVGDLLGIQKSDLDPSTSTVADVKDDPATVNEKYFRGIKYRRQEEETTKGDSSKQDVDGSKQLEDSQEQKKRVKILDSYHKLSSTLTLAQRNSMKDLGFEYAGHLIHSMIRSMGANDVELKSTRLPYGGETGDPRTTPTTQHVKVHEVTTSPMKPSEGSTLAEGVTNLESRFVFRYGNTDP